MQGAETRLVPISCQAKSYNLPCYYCIAQLSANQGRAHPYRIEVPLGGPTRPSGLPPTPLNRKIGVPTLPFIA